ncbi:MAG: hypothetical protein ACLS8R_11445, partial [Anaeromassilibacillus sp.]
PPMDAAPFHRQRKKRPVGTARKNRAHKKGIGRPMAPSPVAPSGCTLGKRWTDRRETDAAWGVPFPSGG